LAFPEIGKNRALMQKFQQKRVNLSIAISNISDDNNFDIDNK